MGCRGIRTWYRFTWGRYRWCRYARRCIARGGDRRDCSRRGLGRRRNVLGRSAPVGYHVAGRTIEIDRITVGAGGLAVECSGGVDGNAREGDPARALVPSPAAQSTIAVSHSPFCWREVDPTVVLAPGVAGEGRVGDSDRRIYWGEVDPACDIAPRILIRRRDQSGSGACERRGCKRKQKEYPCQRAATCSMEYRLHRS